MIPWELKPAFWAGKFPNPWLKALLQLVIAMGTGSGRASFINFLELLTKALGLVLQNVDELLQRIVVLNRPIDSLVHKTEARIGECFPLIPISYFKFLHIVMIP